MSVTKYVRAAVRRADRHRHFSRDRLLGVALIACVSCRRTAPPPVDAPAHDAGVTHAAPDADVTVHTAPDAAVQRRPDEDDRAATAPMVAEIARLEQDVLDHLHTVPLLRVTEGGIAVQPFARVVVMHDAIEVDDVGMLFAMRRQAFTRVATLARRNGTPIELRERIPMSYGSPGIDAGSRALAQLSDLLQRIRAVDDVRAGVEHNEPARGINLYADPAAPAGYVHRVLETARAHGFTWQALAERREGHEVALLLGFPGTEPPGASPPLSLRVTLGRDGYDVSIDDARVASGCSTSGGRPAFFPMARGRVDATSLSVCLSTLRTDSDWHDRLSTQTRIAIRFDRRVAYGALLATIAAVGDSRPGARDMFIDPVLEPIE